MNDFCKQKSVKKDIDFGDGPKSVTFYSIPTGTILRMRNMGKSVSRLVATMMADDSKDIKIETATCASEEKDGNGDAYVNTHTTQNEISPSLASFRYKQRTEAIEGMVESITSPEMAELIVEIIVRSARDLFSEADKEEFLEKVPLDITINLLVGAFEASAGGISGLGKFLSPRMQDKIKTSVEAVANDVQKMTSQSPVE